MKSEVENWRDIPGFEGMYQISDLGRVKSLDRIVTYKDGFRKYKGRGLKLQSGGEGYLKIELYKNNSYCRFSVHRLVMLAFEGDSDLVVDHINSIRSDNRLVNLRYLSHRDNVSRGMVNKTSQYTGVSWDKDKQKWRAYLRINTKGYSLGTFNLEEEAHQAYQKSLADYLEKGILPNRIKRTKYVLNLECGIFSESLKEASYTYGICGKALSSKLSGKRKNNTPLIYC